MAKIVVRRTKMHTIIMMKTHIAMSLFRLCRVFMTDFALMYHPFIAAMKNNAAVTRNSGPMNVASLSVRVFNTEVFENAKSSPNATQLTIGRLIQAGTLDSLDF